MRKKTTASQLFRRKNRLPRILIVTPEIAYLNAKMEPWAGSIRAKAGGMADVTASLFSYLYNSGADVHLAVPNYRSIFNGMENNTWETAFSRNKTVGAGFRVHLAEDEIFYKRDKLYSLDDEENIKLSLAFQREVINTIIPRVQPDLIHCHDWMTGLVPAASRSLGIPCLFTLHNVHSQRATLTDIEKSAINTEPFWSKLYFERWPQNYEESRPDNPVDFLASGIYASHLLTTVSPTFMHEIIDGIHDFIPDNIRVAVAKKKVAGCAVGILNAPDPSFDPINDPNLIKQYGPHNPVRRRIQNKRAFQVRMGLPEDPSVPVLFWPSRLDPLQKGCQLFIETFPILVSKYKETGLQVAIVADGPYQSQFLELAHRDIFRKHLAVRSFQEDVSHLGYSASDYMLMPSKYEPCGLSQMISTIYGSIPIVHDTGGLHDTVHYLYDRKGDGNGFLFNQYDRDGFLTAIDKAMDFYLQPASVRTRHIRRIMKEGRSQFCHRRMNRRYFAIYDHLLETSLVPINHGKQRLRNKQPLVDGLTDHVKTKQCIEYN